MSKRELLFSLTKKDFDIQTFKSGGPGGQHQNKTDSGVRIIHRDSGAVSESRSERSQRQNKKIAFIKLAENYKFKIWLNRKVHEIISGITLEEKVNKQMDPSNLKIEFFENGKWNIQDK